MNIYTDIQQNYNTACHRSNYLAGVWYEDVTYDTLSQSVIVIASLVGVAVHGLTRLMRLKSPKAKPQPDHRIRDSSRCRGVAPQVSAARTSAQAFNLGTPSQGAQSKSRGLSRAGGQQPGYMARVYQPNPNLHQVQVGDELQFETPQGQTYPTTVTKVSVTEWGNTVIHGSAGDVKLFAVVNPGGQFFSSIETPEGKFQSSINLGETLVFSGAEGGIAETPFVDDMNLQRLIEEQPDAGASPRLAELSASPTVVTVGILVDDTD